MTAQQLNPLVPPERVRLFAEEESLIFLEPPPFSTIAQERQKGGAGDFWERFGALHQIVPEQALVIGDFGLGSDSPIVLDFHANSVDPPVLRLRWSTDKSNEWVLGARNFDAFARLLGFIADT
ncbi:hypothetical protein AACH06_29270 [Ideonella sp. DXS29W]|uniref:SMI1/KNR4 family protein n=1 Tax=Ideonella lacteola TaxID=2984193 RepID=A0ABU9BYE8_9BURK